MAITREGEVGVSPAALLWRERGGVRGTEGCGGDDGHGGGVRVGFSFGPRRTERHRAPAHGCVAVDAQEGEVRSGSGWRGARPREGEVAVDAWEGEVGRQGAAAGRERGLREVGD